MPERCPACSRPRARASLQCTCGHVFEFVAGADRTTRARSPQLDTTLAAIGVAAALAAYACVPSEPDHAGVGALLVVGGLFSAIAALMNVGWFFRASRARLVTAVLGRAGARVFYTLAGGALVGAGVQLLLA